MTSTPDNVPRQNPADWHTWRLDIDQQLTEAVILFLLGHLSLLQWLFSRQSLLISYIIGFVWSILCQNYSQCDLQNDLDLVVRWPIWGLSFVVSIVLHLDPHSLLPH